MKIISESEMNFGRYDEANLFHIEDSKIYKDLGTGIKIQAASDQESMRH